MCRNGSGRKSVVYVSCNGINRVKTALAFAIAVRATHLLPDRALSCIDRLPDESMNSKNGSPLPEDDGPPQSKGDGFTVNGTTRGIRMMILNMGRNGCGYDKVGCAIRNDATDRVSLGITAIALAVAVGATHHLPDKALSCTDRLPDETMGKQERVAPTRNDGSFINGKNLPVGRRMMIMFWDGFGHKKIVDVTGDGITHVITADSDAIPVGATHHLPDRALSCTDRLPDESMVSKVGSPLPEDYGLPTPAEIG